MNRRNRQIYRVWKMLRKYRVGGMFYLIEGDNPGPIFERRRRKK